MTRYLEAVKAMHDAGVTLVVGTDGAVPGLSVLREIELFVHISPAFAVAAGWPSAGVSTRRRTLRGRQDSGRPSEFPARRPGSGSRHHFLMNTSRDDA